MLVRYIDIAEASGRLGGMVAARNRSGQYLRTWRNPVNPATAYQLAVRQSLAAATAAWNAVSASIRSAWEDYASQQNGKNRIAGSYSRTGQNFFVGSLSFRHLIGGEFADFLDVTPTSQYALPVTPWTPTLTASDDTLSLAYEATDGWCATTGGYAAVFLGRIRPTTQKFFKGPYSMTSFVVGNTALPPASPLEISVGPAVAAGDRLGIRIRCIGPDNRLSSVQTLDAIAS